MKRRVFLRTCYSTTDNLVTPPSRFFSLCPFFLPSLFSSTEFVSRTLRETQGCVVFRSAAIIPQTKILIRRGTYLSLCALAREIRNCQWIKLKENKFSCGYILHVLFPAEPSCIPVERVNARARMRFSPWASRLDRSSSLRKFRATYFDDVYSYILVAALSPLTKLSP